MNAVQAGLTTIDPRPLGPPLRVLLAVSTYNAWVTEPMASGAADAFERLAPEQGSLTRVTSPGAFELPAVVAAGIGAGGFDAAVAVGCVIRGETRHDEVIADAVAARLAALSSGALGGAAFPVGFAMLTVESPAQAEARAGGVHGNKGAEAMEAALACLASVRALAKSGG